MGIYSFLITPFLLFDTLITYTHTHTRVQLTQNATVSLSSFTNHISGQQDGYVMAGPSESLLPGAEAMEQCRCILRRPELLQARENKATAVKATQDVATYVTQLVIP